MTDNKKLYNISKYADRPDMAEIRPYYYFAKALQDEDYAEAAEQSKRSGIGDGRNKEIRKLFGYPVK